jgi:hypothetical protein
VLTDDEHARRVDAIADALQAAERVAV